MPAVRNQGGCGSCWAFATVGVVEAAHYTVTGEVISLSPKQLVDCDSRNFGCDGGFLSYAYDYLLRNGVVAESTYPYFAAKSTCPNGLLANVVARISSYNQLPRNDENAMLNALQKGPLTVAMHVEDNFYYYTGGVYSSTTCDFTPNHAVIVVGAGVDDETGVPYWLVRNSWGEDW